MILSQPELRAGVADGSIAFSPQLEEGQWGEASIDLRLGYQFTKLKRIAGIRISLAEGIGAVADAQLWNEDDLEEPDRFGNQRCYTIQPGEFILARTHEEVCVPRHLIARVEGRSSYARMGLSMHQTAPWIQPGWQGRIILELMNSGSFPIDLTPIKDRPCQITFFVLSSAVPEELAYGAKPKDGFQRQERPFPAAAPAPPPPPPPPRK